MVQLEPLATVLASELWETRSRKRGVADRSSHRHRPNYNVARSAGLEILVGFLEFPRAGQHVHSRGLSCSTWTCQQCLTRRRRVAQLNCSFTVSWFIGNLSSCALYTTLPVPDASGARSAAVKIFIGFLEFPQAGQMLATSAPRSKILFDISTSRERGNTLVVIDPSLEGVLVSTLNYNITPSLIRRRARGFYILASGRRGTRSSIARPLRVNNLFATRSATAIQVFIGFLEVPRAGEHVQTHISSTSRVQPLTRHLNFLNSIFGVRASRVMGLCIYVPETTCNQLGRVDEALKFLFEFWSSREQAHTFKLNLAVPSKFRFKFRASRERGYVLSLIPYIHTYM
ncbi:hypothetical protein B0H16DRAFT_1449426 [Mycena metata]|uniref:Uncharacterized protein n=1 Tax=Mycena metata TaxID=1033252 RepID=A0AAD7NW39_9AGAR|nr:hypothetical protein B0H16DRAFT_1449426 [Mycena metata]